MDKLYTDYHNHVLQYDFEGGEYKCLLCPYIEQVQEEEEEDEDN